MLPGPVCSVWTAGSVHHEDPPSRLGNGTELMSSSGQQCQTWLGRRGPLVPNTQESRVEGIIKQSHEYKVMLVHILEREYIPAQMLNFTCNFSSPSRTW